MYITPNSKIRLIKNCPLDKSQENTIYFTSVSAQTTYFTSTLSGYLFDKNTYQRVHKGVLRVAQNAESLYNCNYLAFQNTSFGDKWFYAFIDSIEYVNNVTSEVKYTIDVMQTWHFNYQLEMCFVEREHSVTDAIGDNIVEEKLATGDYIISNYSEPDSLDEEDFDIVLFCTVDQNYNPIGGYWNGYMGSGLFPKTFPNTYAGLTQMQAWVNDFDIHSITIDKAIVCACVMPHFMTTASANPGWSDAPVTTMLRSDGTQVKNNKCLTYPYNFLYVTNYQGRGAAYRYEFFRNKIACTFSFFGKVTPDPLVIAAPFAYKKDYSAPEEYDHNFDESIELRGFPQMPWNIDSFKAWLAQSVSSLATSTIAVGTSLLSGNPAAAVSAASGLVGKAVEGVVESFMPPQSRGNSGGAGKFSTGKLTFGFMNKHITPEYATIIDDYFTMFGYATNKVKIPNRTARPEWNYIKTIGCKIQGINSGSGGLPADDADEIENIYNKGIRFWTNPAHIGDYSYNNAPIIQGGG